MIIFWEIQQVSITYNIAKHITKSTVHNCHTSVADRRPTNNNNAYNRVTSRPIVPTPPPRSSSYDNRQSGISGSRNTIGNNSIWDRLFGGGGSSSNRNRPSSRGSRDYYPKSPSTFTTSRPSSSRLHPGGKDKYDTHVSTDKHGNKVWTFSGWKNIYLKKWFYYLEWLRVKITH